jgi:hypothetical protein
MTQDGLWYMILHHTFSLTSRSEGVDENGNHLGFTTTCRFCCNRIEKDFSKVYKSTDEEWRDFPHDEECISARDKLLVEFEKYKLQKEEAKSSQ